MPDHIPFVLIIDDSEDDVFLTRTMIERHARDQVGQLQVLGGGPEGLDYFEQAAAGVSPEKPADPDVLLLDLYMPLLSGEEFLTAFERDYRERFSELAVYLSTSGVSQVVDELLSRFSWLSGQVSKPPSAEEVEMLLSRHGKPRVEPSDS